MTFLEILQEKTTPVELIRYLLRHGAGTINADDPKKFSLEMIAAELEDGLKLETSGGWGYEIAKIVQDRDWSKLKKLVSDIEPQK